MKSRLETQCLNVLREVLRLKDIYGQGEPVTADALDLLLRAEDALLPIGTSMTCGPVIETRPELVAQKVAA